MFHRCTPIIPVSSVRDAAAWFRTHLGFEAIVLSDGHAYICRDKAALRLVPKAPDMDLSDPKRQQSCYLDVDDVDAVYAAHRSELDTLPDGFFRPPFDRDYGQREFHVIHESLLIFVGHALPKDPDT